MRTELTTALKGNVNALASSIVLVCRKRAPDAGKCTRREFINALHRELRPALIKLQSANIAPVDLAQSAIGPGIGVFSRYQSVLESDGRPMSVRAALQIINQELDAFYNEQEGELDRDSRFCVELFSQYAFNTIKFGDADILARAKNTSVQALADRGVLAAAKGQVPSAAPRGDARGRRQARRVRVAPDPAACPRHGNGRRAGLRRHRRQTRR